MKKMMKNNNPLTLVVELSNVDETVRTRARNKLVSLGGRAVPYLIAALYEPGDLARKEAAIALSEIHDPTAPTRLVKDLENENPEIRWHAAQCLTYLNRAAVISLLNALVKHFDSVWLREGARHVFHVLMSDGTLTEKEEAVYQALNGFAPEIEVAWAAKAALEDQEEINVTEEG